MTWNLENLFPAGHQYGPRTAEVYAEKLGNIAATVRHIEPDIVAVQEVGDPDVIVQLQTRLGGDYAHAKLSESPDPRGIRVGLLSRWPLDEVNELVAFPPAALTAIPDTQGHRIEKMGRGALKAQVTLPSGQPLIVVTVHLKSKLITYPGGRRSTHDEDERAREAGAALLRRTAEAVAVRVYVNGFVVGNNRPLILLGDLNDRAEAETTRILLGPEDQSLARPDRFDDVRLYNLAEYIPEAHRYSRNVRGERELIDHILVSHELMVHRPEVDSHVDPVVSITESVESRRDAVYPDHAPVFATFELEP